MLKGRAVIRRVPETPYEADLVLVDTEPAPGFWGVIRFCLGLLLGAIVGVPLFVVAAILLAWVLGPA
jgi:hypothetical protein